MSCWEPVAKFLEHPNRRRRDHRREFRYPQFSGTQPNCFRCSGEGKTITSMEVRMTEPVLDLTVIIPSYNTRNLLRNCLDSIYRHTDGIRFEIICVDGNSPDGSADMVARRFPDVILIRNTMNESYAKSANQGIRRSRGRYVCLLDSDTLMIQNVLEPLVRFMDELADGQGFSRKADPASEESEQWLPPNSLR